MLLKPRFGSRMWSGIWPPSKPLIDTPERALAPFWPRPAVLPRPEPMPRPTRTRLWRAPLLSRISFSFIILHSLSLLSRFALYRSAGEGWSSRRERKGEAVLCETAQALTPTLSRERERENWLRRLFHLQQV